MFTQQIGRSGRQAARRLARAGQVRGYAAPGESVREHPIQHLHRRDDLGTNILVDYSIFERRLSTDRIHGPRRPKL